MKRTFFIYTIIFCITGFTANAQKDNNKSTSEHGRMLNIGAGIGYYGYGTTNIPAIILNYEFDAAKNFTLAPFIGIYSYSNDNYWGSNNHPYKYYRYNETIIPIGVKGVYYFDDLLKANNKWDFYAGASLGFQFHSVTWEDGYYGNTEIKHSSTPLFLAVHVGARLHLSQKVGLYLDLSSGISSFGLSFKL